MEDFITSIYFHIAIVTTVVIAIRFYKLYRHLQDTGSNFTEYFSKTYHKRSLISTIIVMAGFYGYLIMLSFSHINGRIEWFTINALPFLFVCIAGILFQVFNYYESRRNNAVEMEIITNEQLERSLKGTKYMMLYFVSMPLWFLLLELPNLYYQLDGSDESTLLGYDLKGISDLNLILVISSWSLIYLLGCTTLFHFYQFSKQIKQGDFYSEVCIRQLSRAGKMLMVTSFFLLLYSFIQPILIGNTGSTLFGSLFWIGYFIMTVSVFVQYLSKMMKRAALLKEENDLTI